MKLLSCSESSYRFRRVFHLVSPKQAVHELLNKMLILYKNIALEFLVTDHSSTSILVARERIGFAGERNYQASSCSRIYDTCRRRLSTIVSSASRCRSKKLRSFNQFPRKKFYCGALRCSRILIAARIRSTALFPGVCGTGNGLLHHWE